MNATFVRKLTGWKNAYLYRLSEIQKCERQINKGKDEEGNTIFEDGEIEYEYVIVSAVDPPLFSLFDNEPETFLFPADEEGSALSMGELPGSYKGEKNVQQALYNFLGEDCVVYDNPFLEEVAPQKEEEAHEDEGQEEEDEVDLGEPFMIPEVFEDDGYIVECQYGDRFFIPADAMGSAEKLEDFYDYQPEGNTKPVSFEAVHGWWGRMSAPGYLDCTDWCYAETQEEIQRELGDEYMSDEWGEPLPEFSSDYEEFFQEVANDET